MDSSERNVDKVSPLAEKGFWVASHVMIAANLPPLEHEVSSGESLPPNSVRYLQFPSFAKCIEAQLLRLAPPAV
jgi:hypothetical protein